MKAEEIKDMPTITNEIIEAYINTNTWDWIVDNYSNDH